MTALSRPWTPDQPLRVDATDEQIIARYHAHYEPQKQVYQSFADIAREFARASVAALSAAVLPTAPPTPQAILEIASERERQKSGEGWTEAHDDTHVNGELAIAAACYAAPVDHEFREATGTYFTQSPDCWPWTPDWWKGATQSEDHRRDLVKAGALIVAEIERLDRAAIHINTRDEHGVSKPISPALRDAVQEAAQMVRAMEVQRGSAATAPPPDTLESRFIDALENREVEVECMGTSVPYINLYPKAAGVEMQTTAGQTQTLRQAIAKVLP